ncbi:monocarboxylate transporter 9 [Rhipicephalus sanguineus]|uniref:monocarboxylate transporter 9 n=1 Tax=Rhipicephalus sanguineus TaxID=34632 RepID=UPI0018952E0E|nr:monocarboxylate transporter 9 [Rhipicephalus sanguineus]
MALSMIGLKNDPSFGLDSRRSWVTATFLCLSLKTMLIGQHSVGVLFYGIVRMYGISRKDASWPLVLSQSLSLLGGPVAGYLCTRFSCRVVLLASTFAGGAAVSACFFADSILYLNILFGIVYGSATCGVHVAVSVLVSQHFEKRRATACSLMYTLTCVNSLYLPPLAELLRVTYGIHGTLLLLGGMIMNALPPVLAVRSPEWVRPRRQSRGNTVNTQKMAVGSMPNSILLSASGTHDCKNPGQTELSHEKTIETEVTQVPLVQNGSSCLSALRLRVSHSTLTGKDNVGNTSFTTTVREFASMSVAVNAISFSLVAFGMSTFLLLSVDIAVDKGIMPSSGVFLLNAFAVADIATRPLSGVVIDSGLLTLESVMLLGYVLQLLALELFVWLDAFPLLLASSVIFGVSNGSRITLLPPFLAKEFGVDRMPGLLGGVSFWSGVVLISGPFLVGYWRDNLGSYDGILHFVAALNAAVAVIWVAKLYVQRRRKSLV